MPHATTWPGYGSDKDKQQTPKNQKEGMDVS